MQITLYKCTDDKRKLNKSLGTALNSCAVIPTETLSLLEPNFLILKSDFNFNANYLYCDTFQRYYYIHNVRVLSAQRVLIECVVDVLNSFKDEILQCSTVATRNENTPINNITDNNLPIISAQNTRVVKFSKNPFNVNTVAPNDRNFILSVSGGGQRFFNNGGSLDNGN